MTIDSVIANLKNRTFELQVYVLVGGIITTVLVLLMGLLAVDKLG